MFEIYAKSSLIILGSRLYEKDRKFLSNLKTYLLNIVFFHFMMLVLRSIFFMRRDYEIMFIQIREKEEIESFVAQFGSITLLIKRHVLNQLKQILVIKC